MYGCAFLAFVLFFFFRHVSYAHSKRCRHFFFSGSGQRLIFLITFFLYIFFSFRGYRSLGGSFIFSSVLMGSI